MRIMTHRLSTYIALSFVLVLCCGCNTTSGSFSNQVGSSHYKKGNYTAARHSFARAVADRPDNPDYMFNLASAMQKQGDIAGAEQTYRTALQVDPGHQPSYHGLASLMNDQGRQAESHSLLQAWAQTQPYSPKPHVEMAWLQRETGQTAAAEQSLQTALHLQPNHPIALSQLGQLYQEQGQSQQASALYKRSLANNWSQPHVHSRLAMLEDSQRIQSHRTGSTMTAAGWGVPQPQTAWQVNHSGMPTTAFVPPTMMGVPPATYAEIPSGIYSTDGFGNVAPMTTALPVENQFNADPAHIGTIPVESTTIGADVPAGAIQ